MNFWNDIIKYFSEYFNEVIILSINNRNVACDEIGDNIYLYNVKPFYFSRHNDSSDPEYTGVGYNKLPLSVIYKTATLLKQLPFFEKLISKHNIGVVHYFRVFGLFNRLLIRKFPNIKFSITVPTHIDRAFPLQYLYHITKYRTMTHMDYIVTTTKATKERLSRLGIFDKNKLKYIPWSVESIDSVRDDDDIVLTRKLFSLLPRDRVVLWSGPLQDSGKEDFYYALKIAKHVTKNVNDIRFIFAFKPDRLRMNIKKVLVDENISIIETTKKEFNKLIEISDIFLSPITNSHRTVAPPLTWIEVMQRGVPVITNPINGVEELVINGYNGYICSSVAQAVQTITSITPGALKKLRENSKDFTWKRYKLEDIARRYIDMWNYPIERKSL